MASSDGYPNANPKPVLSVSAMKKPFDHGFIFTGETDRLAFILNQFEAKELPISLTQFIEYVAFYENFN